MSFDAAGGVLVRRNVFGIFRRYGGGMMIDAGLLRGAAV